MKVLAYTSPARGHLFPIVPVLLELRRRGHQVAVRTIEGASRHLGEIGLDASSVSRSIAAIEHDDYLARSPVAALKRSTAVFARRAAFEPDDLRDAIAETSPDLLIVDANCWGAAAAAELGDIPWASYLPYPAPLPGRGIPPFGPGLAPARGPVGRLRDRILRPVVLGTVERALTPVLNGVRAEIGAPPITDATDLFTRSPLTLYLTAEPFEYHRSDWPASFRLVGPMSYDPPAEPPSWLEQEQRPVVLVTTSSEFQDDGRLLTTAFEALRDEDVLVVGTLPAGDAEHVAVPPNGRLETFLPHSLVLDRAACVISHGGMGATQKALAAGVPVVVVPFGRDQLEVARRAELTGAGVRLLPRKLTAERLRDAVREARGRRRAATELAARLAAAGGAPRAADELELHAGVSAA